MVPILMVFCVEINLKVIKKCSISHWFFFQFMLEKSLKQHLNESSTLLMKVGLLAQKVMWSSFHSLNNTIKREPLSIYKMTILRANINILIQKILYIKDMALIYNRYRSTNTVISPKPWFINTTINNKKHEVQSWKLWLLCYKSVIL